MIKIYDIFFSEAENSDFQHYIDVLQCRRIHERMLGVQFIDRKGTEDLMLVLDLNKKIDQLAMSSSVWIGIVVLRRKGGCVLRKA